MEAVVVVASRHLNHDKLNMMTRKMCEQQY